MDLVVIVVDIVRFFHKVIWAKIWRIRNRIGYIQRFTEGKEAKERKNVYAQSLELSLRKADCLRCEKSNIIS